MYFRIISAIFGHFPDFFAQPLFSDTAAPGIMRKNPENHFSTPSMRKMIFSPFPHFFPHVSDFLDFFWIFRTGLEMAVLAHVSKFPGHFSFGRY